MVNTSPGRCSRFTYLWFFPPEQGITRIFLCSLSESHPEWKYLTGEVHYGLP